MNFVGALLLLASRASLAQATTLIPGDIAVIGIQSKVVDAFKLIVLRRHGISAGTEFHVTDSGVYGPTCGFGLSEGTWKYRAVSNLDQGHIIPWCPDCTAPEWDMTGWTKTSTRKLDIATYGDQIIVYTKGSGKPNQYVYAAQTNSNQWQTLSRHDNEQSQLPCNFAYAGATPVPLINGETAVALGAGSGAENEYDNAYYTTRTACDSRATCLAAIGNPANWLRKNTNIGTFITVLGGLPEPDKCETYTCPDGWTADPSASNELCAVAGCGAIDNDLCCEANPACSTHTCPAAAGWLVDDTASSTLCALSPCGAADNERCCHAKTSQCSAGSYFTAAVSATDDNFCTPCNSGSFKVETNAETSCASKTIVCPSGKFFTFVNGATDDNTCTTCDSGYFKVGENAETSCTQTTAAPTLAPTFAPSAAPSASPSASPSTSPSTSPSVSPTSVPSTSPTTSPSTSPSGSPTASPTTGAPTVRTERRRLARGALYPFTLLRRCALCRAMLAGLRAAAMRNSYERHTR